MVEAQYPDLCIEAICQVQIRDASFAEPPGTPYTWQADLHRDDHPSFVAETPVMAPRTSLAHIYLAGELGRHDIELRMDNGATALTSTSIKADVRDVALRRLVRLKGSRCKVTYKLKFTYPRSLYWAAHIRGFGNHNKGSTEVEARGRRFAGSTRRQTLSLSMMIPRSGVRILGNAHELFKTYAEFAFFTTLSGDDGMGVSSESGERVFVGAQKPTGRRLRSCGRR